ncbi:hypothetical protein CA13_39020 [Planctomycetes bacterium CA13]|uniref:GDSL-like Lipase/Acylhydrolase n=1 Tax=Novipirellula herctigrandis TaxID=2527986 RepID=A0A5C5Z4X1_9BACT|nr:hypothetical protein CA13_39020 [Planctomycetes bacterium CA13]
MRCLYSLMVMFLCGSMAQAQLKMGAVGDSLLDEHFDQTGFGVSLGYSMNALELMRAESQIDLGLIDDWGDTRGTGYEYNWALAGSTTGSLITSGQHLNFAAQIPTAGITKAVLIVGSNDLFPAIPNLDLLNDGPSGPYQAIYEGLSTTSQIQDFASQAVNDVITAAQTIRATGVDLIVASAPDYGITPVAKRLYPDAAQRDLVDDVMELYNVNAIQRLTTEVGVPVVDLYTLTKDMWGDHGQENNIFTIGGVDFDLEGTGGVDLDQLLQLGTFSGTPTDDVADAFVHDGFHPNTGINGLFANVFMTAFNQEFNDNFMLFSEEEILALGGPTLEAQYDQDTLASSLAGKSYADYVISPAAVPEPRAVVLLVGMATVAAIHRTRKKIKD